MPACFSTVRACSVSVPFNINPASLVIPCITLAFLYSIASFPRSIHLVFNMRLLSILSGFLAAASAAPPNEASAEGSLSLQSTYPSLAFRYHTPSTNNKNWIGIWPADKGSVDQKLHGNSTVWRRAPKSDGVVELSTDKLTPGNYKAYFLKDGDYKRAAYPVSFHMPKLISGNIDVSSTTPITIQYTTTKPNAKNWIGMYYASGGGPENEEEEKGHDSVSWKYAPESQGSVVLDTSTLPDGKYKVFFLANDGYNWIATPVEVTLGKSNGYFGEFRLDYKKKELTFTYSTTQPNDHNWIGVYYAYGGGPEHDSKEDASLAWIYAPGEQGTVTVNATALDRDCPYKAFYLANNQYKWVSPPVLLSLAKPHEGFEFLVERMTAHNARQGEVWKMNFSQLLNHAGDPRTKFSVVDNDEGWIQLNPKTGTLSGTPGPKDKNMTIIVQAENAYGILAFLELDVPVVPAGKPMVEQLRVLSMNLWNGGRSVDNFHKKQVRFIAESNVDIVGFQESSGRHGARIANALGWNHWQGDDVSIVSRYPFAEVYPTASRSGSVRVALDGNKSQVIFWNAHLGNTSYGPYGFCYDHLSTDTVMKHEDDSGRTSQIKDIVSRMKEQIAKADSVPVFFVGGFNSPSHLDWTDANKHCGIGYVPWSCSEIPLDAGLKDSYRVAHPDPVADPGVTWSPVDLEHEGKPQPLDRIDYILYKSAKLEVLSSEAVMFAKPKPLPNVKKNEWPSDHKAVLTVFKVKA